jgi:hypothetical protein
MIFSIKINKALNLRCLLYLLIMISTFPIFNCGKLTGEFAFKTDIEDRYKIIRDIPEFRKETKVDWCFTFNRVSGERKIWIFLMEKEMVWIDVEKRFEFIKFDQKVIYGSIENLEAGYYKIVLTEGENLIDEKEFLISSEQD